MVVGRSRSIRIHQLVQDKVNVTDTTILFKMVLPIVPNLRKRFLVVKNTEYIIASWT